MKVISTVLILVVGIALAIRFALRRSSEKANPLARVGNSLQASTRTEREIGIRRAVESATPEAWTLLVELFGRLNSDTDSDERRQIFRELIKGWGRKRLVDHWDELPAHTRMDFLELANADGTFARSDLLLVARSSMRDSDDSLARHAWRIYAYTVTWAVERQSADFDFPAWHAETAEDGHSDLQDLRKSLSEKRIAETSNLGIDSMVTRYRREVFKAIAERTVNLMTTTEHTVTNANGEEFLLPIGLYKGTLSGVLDNAQDALANGWQFRLELDDSRVIQSAWHASAFFGEVLDPAHDGRRTWFEEAPEEILQALALQPLVGPAVAWTEDLDLQPPLIDGVALEMDEEQMLMCLIALLPGEEGQGDELVILNYETKAQDDEDDEIRPFTTVLPLEKVLLNGNQSQLI
ncbi:MAG: hypothetical protein ACI8X5_000849 [Planctomycetota bacterium]|jgi:hypothetical protein